MRLPTPETPWYIEVRRIGSSEKISLDLSRHLALRTSVGTVVIVTERPSVLLPVIKKRWAKVLREVERQCSSTLDRLKKEGLRQELYRLRKVTFAINTAYVDPPTNIIFSTPEHLHSLRQYRTLYLLTPLSKAQWRSLPSHLVPESLLVSYCALPEDGGAEG
jgi:hypothetical protein